MQRLDELSPSTWSTGSVVGQPRYWRAVNPPIYAVLSSGFSGVLTNTNRRPVLLFSFIKGDQSTHPCLTRVVSMSFRSHDIEMSKIHTFVTGNSSSLPPLKMNEFLSCTCTVCCRRVIPSINNTFRAVLVRGYTRDSPRISCAPSIVSAPLIPSAARHSSNVSYLEPSPECKSRRNRKLLQPPS